VEHTVTEEVTDVDLVQSQLRIAAGETLADLGLSQDTIVLRGAALQCRITTEDPANGCRPDTGRITAYRFPGGAGIRLDGGAALGAEVETHVDSLLLELGPLPHPHGVAARAGAGQWMCAPSIFRRLGIDERGRHDR
jgi:pyruvate carboxylase